MSVINVLSKEISELIAAGEVIERPASVIKELVENSIDAGATHITVEIKQGGTIYMRITDDGCGIAYDDVPTAFLRHATSKITDKSDLDNICTLGFRGEALASVAAVSKAEIMTKRPNDAYGTRYCIQASCETLYEQSGCPDGTTIIIRDLFYNVPARQKFMKKDVTEANAVSQIMQKITLSHPEVAFRFIRDNRTEFNSCGDGELYSAVYSVYGRDFARDLMEVDSETNGIRVKGFAIKPLYAKANRSFQNFFVNGRFVKSRLCSSALESAYDNMIMTGKFPACVLMLDLPPVGVDVNIHPAKAEVRFTNEKAVSDAVFFAVKNAMLSNGLIYEFQVKSPTDWKSGGDKEPEQEFVQQELIFTKPDDIEKAEQELEIRENTANMLNTAELRQDEDKSGKISQTTKASTDEDVITFDELTKIKPSEVFEKLAKEQNGRDNQCSDIKPMANNTADEPQKVSQDFKYITAASFASETVDAEPEVPTVSENLQKPQIKVIGEAFKNYIMAEADNCIVMIDKHAAHERIIFERLKSQNCRQYRQLLISECKVLLSGAEIDALENNREKLENMGFSFDFSEKPYVITTAVPGFFNELDFDEIIPEIAENLVLGKQNPQTHKFDDILHSLACKSAIKANDITDIRELQALAEQVYGNENIRHCPHGRPVMFTLPKNSIEHQFKRT